MLVVKQNITSLPACLQVLVLVESLHAVSATFDKCRAVRYQQSLEKELRQKHKTSHAAAVRRHHSLVHVHGS